MTPRNRKRLVNCLGTLRHYSRFLVIQAQYRAEQGGQYEKQDRRHENRGNNFLEVTSGWDACFRGPSPLPLGVLGNTRSRQIQHVHAWPPSRAFVLQDLLLVLDLRSATYRDDDKFRSRHAFSHGERNSPA